MRKIDDFFHKRLSDYSETNDGWNIPDDVIWVKASAQFPKKEKKKYLLIWILFGIGLALGFSGGLFMNSETDSTSTISNSQPYNEDVDKVKKTKEDHASISDLNSMDKADIDINNSSKQRETTTSTNEPITKTNKFKSLSKQLSIIEEDGPFITSAKEVETKSKASSTKNLIPSFESVKVLDKENQSIETKIVGRESAVKEDEKNRFEDQPEDLSTEAVEDLNKRMENKKFFMNLLPRTPLAKLSHSSSESFTASEPSLSPSPFIKKSNGTFPKREVGINRRYFLLSLLNGQNLQDDPRDQIFFTTDFNNLGVFDRHWISKNVSLQYGASYVNLIGNLDFSAFYTLEQDDVDEFLDLKLRDLTNRSKSFMNDEALNDFPELLVGDEVNLSGLVDLNVRFIQLPILMHYHWYKKRFELFAGGGLALDYAWGTEEASDFQLVHDGIPYQIELEDDVLEDDDIALAVFLDAGLKFHLTQNINVEFTLKAEVLNPLLSGIECGIYYRWNRE